MTQSPSWLDQLKCKFFGHKFQTLLGKGCLNIGYCVRRTRHQGAIFKMNLKEYASYQANFINPDSIADQTPKADV